MNYRYFILGALIAVAVYLLRCENDKLSSPITVIQHADEVEKYLTEHKTEIGEDYDAYRGHIYRVLSYAMHYLNGDTTHFALIAAALVYHDIGLWTHKTLAYLEPSSLIAKDRFRIQYSREEIDLLREIIVNHHQITPYEGPHADVVNAVRRADWIDATMGLVNHGMPATHIAAVQGSIPNAGFHKALVEFGPRLYGWNVVKTVSKLSTIFKW